MLEVESIMLSILLAFGGFLCLGCCCFSCGRKKRIRLKEEEKKMSDSEMLETGKTENNAVEAIVHNEATHIPNDGSELKDIKGRQQIQETDDGVVEYDIKDEIRELPDNCTT